MIGAARACYHCVRPSCGRDAFLASALLTRKRAGESMPVVRARATELLAILILVSGDGGRRRARSGDYYPPVVETDGSRLRAIRHQMLT